MGKLTIEQQKTIENSMWVVNTALKQQGLQADDDIRQSAILYMCQCLQRFDPTKNIKWTTFAYKSVYLYIKRILRQEKKKQAHIVEEDLFDLAEPFKKPLDEPMCFNESKYSLGVVLSKCTPREKEILALKMKGFKAKEISKIINYSQSTVSLTMKSIKQKVKELKNNE